MKNGKIELMRFLFSIAIVFYHGQRHFMSIDNSTMHLAFFARGYIGVEFFFLVTGFLMASSVYKRIQREPLAKNIGEETFGFTLRKIKGIFPYHIVSFVILFITEMVIKHFSVRTMVKQFLDMIPGILLIQKAGFDYSNLNRVEWYISCMIFSLMILYPICRKYYSMFVHVFAPVGGLFILGYLAQTYGTFTGINKWDTIIFVCMLRAIAEISFGAVVFEMSRKLGKKEFTKYGRGCITALECVCYIILIIFIMSTIKTKYEIYAVFVMMVAIAISFSGKSYGGKVFNNRFCYKLGKWSLPIYLNQVFALNILEKLHCGLIEKMILLLVLTLIGSSICKFSVQFFKRFKIKKILIDNQA